MDLFNHYLLESLNTNKLTISITNTEYERINRSIIKFKKIYQKKIESIYLHERNLVSMHKHCKIVKKIIYNVIKLFPIMKEYGACAFITGSFARCSCKKNSDLDLHIVYLKKYNDESLKYEEIIYYMLSQIFNIERSKIHPMIITKMYPEASNYLEKKLDKSDLLITIKCNEGEYNYTVNANVKRRIYLEYCRKNKIEDIFLYLKKEVNYNNSEWAHVVNPITMKKQFNKYYDNLLEYERNKYSNYNSCFNRIKLIKKEITEINDALNKIKNTNISEFKKVYQIKEFALINEYISYKRDMLLISGKKWKIINYYYNRKYLGNDSTFKNILDYMFELFKIVEPLENRYSIHSNEIIVLNDYKKIESRINSLNKKIMLSIEEEEEKINGKINNNHANNTI